MDGSNALIPDDLDRELADALRVQPSGEFRARIRERVSAEEMTSGWWLPVPLSVCAGVAGFVAVSAMWLLAGNPAPSTQARSGIRPAPVAAAPATPAAGNERASIEAPVAVRVGTGQERHEPATVPVAAAGVVGPDVLISESERSGLRLLFESVAAGRLQLPEDMLQDLSLPIVEARTGVPDLDSPWREKLEGDVR